MRVYSVTGRAINTDTRWRAFYTQYNSGIVHHIHQTIFRGKCNQTSARMTPPTHILPPTPFYFG